LKTWDITPAIGPGLAVWPGDTPPTREVLLDMKRGDNLTLSTLHGTVHLGAHADAPSHYETDGETIELRAVERYLGPCRVARIDAPRGERLGVECLPSTIDAPRLLVATGSYPDPNRLNEDFAAFEPAFLREAHARGVRLIGIDTPSVDLFESKDLPAHQVCRELDVAILEGLVLDGVPEGRYELIALPLKLVGFDGSPVRAVLRELP